MVQHLKQQFALTMLSQYGEQIAGADITGGQPVAMFMDVRNEVVQHGFFISLGNHHQENR